MFYREVSCLQEYNSPDEYIADVQKHIRWKRAKVVVTKELYEHISDQFDFFVANGFEESEAMKKAIQEMGSADVVGTELDNVHRPKMNWLLLALIGLLLLIGMTISFMLLSTTETLPKVYGIVCGFGVAIFVYYVDYTVLIRYPRLIYFILSILAIITSVWELRNGFSVLGYSYTFYLLLCYPIALVGILFNIKNSGSNIGIVLYAIYACCPLVLAILNKSFTAFISILICSVFLLIYGLKLNWIKWNKLNIIGASCIVAFLAIFVFFINQFYDIVSDTIHIDSTQFYQLNLFSALGNSELIGKSSISINEQLLGYLYDHPISLLLYNYGIVLVLFLLAAFGLLFYLLYKTVKKQNTEVGKLLANMVLMIFGIKLVGTLMCEIGILPDFNIGFPFVTTGGVFIIYDLALIGIILSIIRNESIAKDWVRLKEKRRIENE